MKIKKLFLLFLATTCISTSVLSTSTHAKTNKNSNNYFSEENINLEQNLDKIYANIMTTYDYICDTIENSKENSNEKTNKINNLTEQTIRLLNENGFNSYLITQENYDKLSNELNMNFDSLFTKDTIPNSFILTIPKNRDLSISNNNQQKAVSLNDYIWIRPENNPRQASMKNKVLWSKSSSNFSDFLRKSANFALGQIQYVGQSIALADLIGISPSSVGNHYNNRYELKGGVAWHRKMYQAQGRYGWQNVCSVEYANVDLYGVADYYDKNSGRMVVGVNRKKSNTIYSRKYRDNNWILKSMQQGLNGNYIIHDTTGSVDFKYNNKTQFTISGRF